MPFKWCSLAFSGRKGRCIHSGPSGTNLTSVSWPGMSNLCHRMGWQVAHVPPSSKNRGGVAILCRKPCALLELRKHLGPEGQYIMVQMHVDQRVFNMYSHYRHAKDSDFSNLHAICEQIEIDNATDWCVALDGNSNMLEGPCHDMITRVGGKCVATAGHTQSSCLIDGIWVSPKLDVISARHNKPGDGDHGIAEVEMISRFLKFRNVCGDSLTPPKSFSLKILIVRLNGLMLPLVIRLGVLP